MKTIPIDSMMRVADEPLTFEKIKAAAEALINKPAPIFNDAVFIGENQSIILKYFAMKYPKGAKLVRRVSKKRIKNKSSKCKKYFVSSIVPPSKMAVAYDKEAVGLNGFRFVNYDPFIDYEPLDAGLVSSKEQIERFLAGGIKKDNIFVIAGF